MNSYPGHAELSSIAQIPVEEPSIEDRFHLYLFKVRGVTFCPVCGKNFSEFEMSLVEKHLDQLKMMENLSGNAKARKR